jgi:simple sugar transport system substrate-binding protein
MEEGMRSKIIAMAAVPVLALLAACSSSGSAAPSSSSSSSSTTNTASGGHKTYTIYFAPEAIPNSFWAPMKAGALAAAKVTGDKVVWTEGTTFDTQQTVQRMQVAIASHPNALVVTDLVPSAFDPVMAKARAAGIAVFDSNAQSTSANPPYLMYFGANETQAGQLAGQKLLASGKPTRVMCGIVDITSAALAQRCAGLASVLTPKGVPVDKVDVSGTPSEVSAKMQAYFTAHPTANGVYLTAADPTWLKPLMTVVGGLSHHVSVISNDNSTLALQEIQAGKMTGTIIQQQYLQGYLPVIYADLYLRYGFLPATDKVYTGPFFVDKANAGSISSLLQQGIQG